MKIVHINTVCSTSVGNIMGNIQRIANKKGIETLTIYGRRKGYRDLPCIKVGNGIDFWMHVILTTITDRHGLGSRFMTRRIVRVLRKEHPDIIHLHNIHGYYLNYPILFDFLKNEYKGKIFWTLHDCWAFTGHCAYYTAANCNKWKDNCNCCAEKGEYPISWFLDASSYNYNNKKKNFTGLQNLTLIVPSQWLQKQVIESFLKEYPIKIVSNGIDLQLFKPIHKDAIRNKYKIPSDKKILLGVAMYWTKRKGLEDFLNLASLLDRKYVIVLVGVSARQKKNFPSNIIGIERTEDISELVALYSNAHIFINPSIEETFSMVTIEAMACGTPVIALDTSAVCELITEETGIIVHRIIGEKDATRDYKNAISIIEKRIESGMISEKSLTEHAKRYSAKMQAEDMIELYRSDNKSKS